MLSSCRRDYISKTKGGKFQVKSRAGKVLGEHKTRAEALQQLRAVEYHKAHDSAKNMGQLELPRGGDYQTESIGTMPPEAEGRDASAVSRGGTDPGLNSDPLQPHELPERRSNPHHASDPLNERSASGEVEEEHRYLAERDSSGSPGGTRIVAQAPAREPFEQEKCDESGAPGGEQVSPNVWPALENLATERAEEREAIHEGGPGPLGDNLDNGGAPWPPSDDQAGRPERAQLNAPWQPGRNGDPSPNPSGQKTINKQVINPSPDLQKGVAVFKAPDEIVDEGSASPSETKQYEMLSTNTRLHMNEGWEPNYFEQVSGQNGGPDNAYSKTDPAGDDDWLKEIGAYPNKSGETPGKTS